MSRAVIILTSRETRHRAASWVMKAPTGTRVEFKEAKRSTDQNALMWACLTEIARSVVWHGVKLSADDWKLIFLSALKQEMRLVPNLDGTGFVSLGRSSSDLSKAEMSDLIELLFQFGAEQGLDLQAAGGGAEANNLPPRAA
jgi:hypothetical protein